MRIKSCALVSKKQADILRDGGGGVNKKLYDKKILKRRFRNHYGRGILSGWDFCKYSKL